MKFKNAYLKLTGFYVLIVMLVSIGFSLSLYKISSNEIDRGLGKQNKLFQDIPSLNGTLNDTIFDQMDSLRQKQIEESKASLRLKLYYFNLLILVLATISSYFLAQYTMKPIEEAYDAQNRFTADASHELRTPLTAMRSEIEVNLRDPKLNEKEARELLKSNLEEIAKLESLSGALLKLARGDDSIKKSFSKVSLAEVAEAAVKNCEKIANNKNISLVTELNQEAFTIGDKPSLTELVVIFIENAIKYSPNESKIIVDAKVGKDTSSISIKDHGVGIKASDLPHIFERFYRADQSRNKEQVDGYGLGLAIANNIMDMHRGTIAVKSTPGKGSEFILKFKRA